MVKYDGGPAFACAADEGHQEGMSLRDWFAGMAMQAYLNANTNSDDAKVDVWAYATSDAMIEERTRE